MVPLSSLAHTKNTFFNKKLTLKFTLMVNWIGTKLLHTCNFSTIDGIDSSNIFKSIIYIYLITIYY